MTKTVTAITTPIGEGGIGIIQVSGPSAFEIVNKIFKCKKINDLNSSKSNSLFYGAINDKTHQIDEVIVNIHRKCDSYTGEDLVEINCHGGIYLVKKIFDLVISNGAYGTDWSEFSKCFVGANAEKEQTALDMIQNEALQEIPNAKTKLCAKVLIDQYSGTLSYRLSELIKKTAKLESLCDENSQPNVYGEFSSVLSSISADLKYLISTAEFGLSITEPQKIVIVGKPNVGKSTLINTLLGIDRVIVHHEPGTTRDPISEFISIKGIPFNLIDTAGVRKTNHIIEQKGIEITNELTLNSNKLILLFDKSMPLENDDIDLFNFTVSVLKDSNKNISRKLMNQQLIPVLNKIDLPSRLNTQQLDNMFQQTDGLFRKSPITNISAAIGEGVAELENKIVSEFKDFINYSPGKPIIFKNRQFDLLFAAYEKIEEVICLFEKHSNINIYLTLLKETKSNLFNCLNN